jgi:hypothetical protein
MAERRFVAPLAGRVILSDAGMERGLFMRMNTIGSFRIAPPRWTMPVKSQAILTCRHSA